jgi:hypothetical protein
MLKNEMESCVRIGGRGLKNLKYPYLRVEGVKNCQNNAYVINEWPITRMNAKRLVRILRE